MNRLLSSYTLSGNRLYFNDLKGQGHFPDDLFSQASLGIERLPRFAQEKIRVEGLSLVRLIHWRAVVLTNSCQEEIVLVNIRSAVKRLALIGFKDHEVMDLLNGSQFLVTIERSLLKRAMQQLLPQASIHWQYQIPFLVQAKALRREDIPSFLVYLREKSKGGYLYQQELKKECRRFYYDRAFQKITKKDQKLLQGCEEEIHAVHSSFFYEETIERFLAQEKQILSESSWKIKQRMERLKQLQGGSYQKAHESVKKEQERFEKLDPSLEISLEHFQRGVDYAFQWKVEESSRFSDRSLGGGVGFLSAVSLATRGVGAARSGSFLVSRERWEKNTSEDRSPARGVAAFYS